MPDQDIEIKIKAGEPILDSRYVLGERLGQGGMGAVYKATQTTTGRAVAVKVCSDALDDNARKRMEQELVAIRSLHHPNLVGLIDFGYDEAGRPFLVEELLQGETLAQMIARKKFLDQDTIIEIFAQICQGLAHVHEKGFVHRDLKPSNIMVTQSTTGETHIKIIDFGIAKFSQHTQGLTRTGEVIGSPLYMSPEQAQGLKLDSRSDIYSVGCMLFEAATGRPPFLGESPLQTLMLRMHEDPPPFISVSPYAVLEREFEQVVRRTLSRDVKDRYQTCAALNGDLRCLQRVRATKDGASGMQIMRKQAEKQQQAEHASSVMAHGLTVVAVVAIISLTCLAFAVLNSQYKQRISLETPAQKSHPQPPAVTSPASDLAATSKQKIPVPKTLPGTVKKTLKITPLPEDVAEQVEENRRYERTRKGVYPPGLPPIPRPPTPAIVPVFPTSAPQNAGLQLAQALTNRASTLLTTNRQEEAIQVARQAVAAYENMGLGKSDGAAWPLNLEAWGLEHFSRFKEASIARAQMAEIIKLPSSLLFNYGPVNLANYGIDCGLSGQPDQCRAVYRMLKQGQNHLPNEATEPLKVLEKMQSDLH